MTAKRFALLLVLGLPLLAGSALAASSPVDEGAQAVFRGAREYTVKIRTRIETPFLEDVVGSFTGAGFLVDATRGWIVTNAHVVGRSTSDRVEVAFAGEEFRPARKLYVDTFADLAVIAVEGLGARRAAVLDDSDVPSIGEPVGAFGHPLGIPFTGTRGIVSGHTDQFGPDLIQIDATVDHGNSGGPVISLRDRRVVGIATYAAGGGKADRLNFATPIRDVRRVLSLLRAGSPPSPPSLEFALLKDDEGRHTLVVGRTFDAARWPFESGDRIVAVAGREVRSLSDLVDALRGCHGEMTIAVDRGGKRRSLAARPNLRASMIERRGVLVAGALIAPIALEDEAGDPRRVRLIVHSVDPSSMAAALDVQRLDVFDSIDGRSFEDVDALIAYLESRPGDGTVDVVFRRWTEDPFRAMDHHGRKLPLQGLAVIGGAEPPATASK